VKAGSTEARNVHWLAGGDFICHIELSSSDKQRNFFPIP